MENLKITKTFTALALMGTITLTGCGMVCNEENDHCHIFYSEDGFIYSKEEKISGYNKEKKYLTLNEVNQKLIDENRFPLDVVIDYVENKVNDMDAYVEAQYAEPFINKKGKVDFNIYWRFLSNEDLEYHCGIVRTGDSINYIVYNLDGERFEVENLRELEGNYFVDMDEFIVIQNPVEMNYYKKNFIRKK